MPTPTLHMHPDLADAERCAECAPLTWPAPAGSHRCDYCTAPGTILARGLTPSGYRPPYWLCLFHARLMAEPCQRCGRYAHRYTLQAAQINGESTFICVDCATADFMRCFVCAEWHLTGTTEPTFGQSWCARCRDRHLRPCYACDRLVDDRLAARIEGERHCDDCVAKVFGPDIDTTVCEHCGNTFDADNAVYTDDDGGPYCQYCADDCVGWCETCDESVYWPTHECTNDGADLDDYSYQPTYTPQRTGHGDAKAPLFGIELELEARPGQLAPGVELARRLTWCAAVKHDGSLNCGAELVSDPATLTWWQEHSYQVEWAFNELREHFRPYHTCGLHVHVSADGFAGNLHLYKVLTLVHGPAADLSAHVARRRNDSYAPLHESAPLTRKAKGHSGSRYSAINVLSLREHNTVEYRLYASTLNLTKFMAAIEYTAATIDYTRNISISEITLAGFMAFITANRKAYPSLNAYLAANPYPNPGGDA